MRKVLKGKRSYRLFLLGRRGFRFWLFVFRVVIVLFYFYEVLFLDIVFVEDFGFGRFLFFFLFMKCILVFGVVFWF